MRKLGLKHRLFKLYSGFVRLATAWLPDEVSIFRRLRGFLYGLVMPECGRNFQVSAGAILWGLEFFHIGKDVYIGPGVVIICSIQLQVGDGVIIGPYAVINTNFHRFVNGAYSGRDFVSWPVRIGSGAWITAHGTIGPGAQIGNGALVIGGQRVKKVVQDNDIVGGEPAKSLK